jgi:hypothetical protein
MDISFQFESPKKKGQLEGLPIDNRITVKRFKDVKRIYLAQSSKVP